MTEPSVAILVPVLNRPGRVRTVVRNVKEATAGPHRLLFIVCEHDTAELEALKKARADVLVVAKERISWACKINDGFRATDEPWIFTGADDLRFHPDWFERALRWVLPSTRVIGTNDICNHRVMTGQHSTHTLFRRDYVETFGTIDAPGLVMHEGYRHDFTDDEAIATAKARGMYAHAFDAIVEHLHPLVGKADDDDTYRQGRKASGEGRRLFANRKHLWTDEKLVRIAMVPAPKRAVVVTATYGDYDANLHVPAQQDIPTEFVCFTDSPKLQVPAPWKVKVLPGRFPDDPRMSAKVPKMMPDVGCDDVVWVDASHEITSPSFVREALACRNDGFAAWTHPRRDCVYAELDALLGPENQGGLYFSRPLRKQADAYEAEGHPRRAGLYACGVLAWDLRNEKACKLGEAWLEETAKWSHQDQVELPVVCRRLGIEPGTFPFAQIDPRLSRGKRYLANPWLRIHPHTMKTEPVSKNVSVLIPFASVDPARKAAFDFVKRQYEASGFEVIVGGVPGVHEWSKGRALADAYSHATHDVLVIADADCLVDGAGLAAAIRAVEEGAPWAVPHSRTWRLTQQATRRVLQGFPPRQQERPQQAVLGGGIVVVSRESWDKVGGIDPRFIGWGGEDISLGRALQTLCGPGRKGTGKLFHLFHAPQFPRRGSPASEELAGRYKEAAGDERAMRRLVAEASVNA